MRKLTPILNISITANFLYEENKDGKTIHTNTSEIFKLIPFESIINITKAVEGLLVQNKHQMQLFLPFNFENNTVINNVLNQYPDELLFYIQLSDAEKFAYSGLPQNAEVDHILYVAPKNTTTDYQLNNLVISARPCSKGNVIAAADYIAYIPADITLDRIQKLTDSNIHTMNLKFVVEDKTVVVAGQNDLKNLHKQLKEFVNKKVSFSVKNNSDDSLIRDFNKVLITESSMPINSIGIVSIPKSIIKADEINYVEYFRLNQFILHFPSFKARLNITINSNNFTDSDELILDNKPLTFDINNHSQLIGYKQINCNVDNYFFYLYKQKNIVMKSGNKKFEMPFNPIFTYDAKEHVSKINITKNNN